MNLQGQRFVNVTYNIWGGINGGTSRRVYEIERETPKLIWYKMIEHTCDDEDVLGPRADRDKETVYTMKKEHFEQVRHPDGYLTGTLSGTSIYMLYECYPQDEERVKQKAFEKIKQFGVDLHDIAAKVTERIKQLTGPEDVNEPGE